MALDRGADIDSNHHLVVAVIRLKVAVTRPVVKTEKFGKQFDMFKLQDPNIRDKFRLDLRNRFFQLHTHETAIDEEWNHIKVAYIAVSSIVLRQKRRKRDEWISQSTWDLIANRKELDLKLLGTQNEAQRVNLKQVRGKIYRSLRKYRKIW